MPDDHEIFDNVDRRHLNSTRSPVVMAGRQAYYEYEFQLQEDGDLLDSEGHTAPRVLADSIDQHIRIGSTVLVFLDLRFHRVFQFDPKRPLFGQRQMLQLQENLANWGTDDEIKGIVIFTSIPVLFQSTWMCKLSDNSMQEKCTTHPDLLSDTQYFLNALKPFHKKIRFVSGDVHQFVHLNLCKSSRQVCIPALISSGMTRSTACPHSWMMLLYFMVGKVFTTVVVDDWTAYISNNVMSNSYTVLKLTSDGVNWQAVLRGSFSEPFDYRLAVFVFDHAHMAFLVGFLIILLFVGLILRGLVRLFCSPSQKVKSG